MNSNLLHSLLHSLLHKVYRFCNAKLNFRIKSRAPEKRVLEQYVLSMPNYASVLFVGVDWDTMFLSRLCLDLFWVTVDKSKRNLKLAKHSDYAIHCDLASEDFFLYTPDEQYDYVLLDGTLLDLDHNEAYIALDNAYKSLENSGKLLISTVIRPSDKSVLRPIDLIDATKFKLLSNFAGDNTMGISYFFWEYEKLQTV